MFCRVTHTFLKKYRQYLWSKWLNVIYIYTKYKMYWIWKSFIFYTFPFVTLYNINKKIYRFDSELLSMNTVDYSDFTSIVKWYTVVLTGIVIFFSNYFPESNIRLLITSFRWWAHLWLNFFWQLLITYLKFPSRNESIKKLQMKK